MDEVTALLGFRIVRRGVPDSDTQSFVCERLASTESGSPRVTHTSPAREREFVMYEMLKRSHGDG